MSSVRLPAACSILLALLIPSCGSDSDQRTRTSSAPHLDPASDSAVPATDPSDSPSSAGDPSSEPAPLLDTPSGNSEATNASGFIDDGAAAVSALSPEESCAASAVEAKSVERVVEVPIEEQVVVPSVFYLMLDSSGSMLTDTFTLADLVEAVLDLFGLGTQAPRPTKWDYALDGLKTFINDPASQGMQLGLGYFPDVGACDGSGYDLPSVPLAVLPGTAPDIEASLDARVPVGNTPLEGALRGVTGFCQAFNAEHPEASCVAVLITDGAADQCDARGAADLAAIAASARESGVLTYAAGMQGADVAVLDAIGEAGGGDCSPEAPGFACDLTANRQAFVDALSSIRDRTRTQVRIERHVEREVQVLPCEWEIPPPPLGSSFDAERVNVRYALPQGGQESLSRVAAAADCADAGGWFYDDASAPSRVLACPATCDSLRAAPEARVELLFGCKTTLR